MKKQKVIGKVKKSVVAKNVESEKIISLTGIKEFDELLGGGFPKGAVILVPGNSGTGKTIFSFEWLFNGVNKYDENGIYITFTEPLFKTLLNLEGMKFYDRRVVEDEKLKIIDVRKEFGKSDFLEKDFLRLIEEEVRKCNAQRLVLDSITAITYALGEPSKIRKFIFDLGTMLATLGCTTILTSEVSNDKYSAYGVEEFISDGIIVMRQVEQKFQSVRTLEIAKMRGVSYYPGLNTFRISREGIKLFPQLRVPLTHSSGKVKVSTGITGFEESKEQVLRNAQALGMDMEKYEKNGLLKIISAYPSEKYIEEHLLDIKELIDKFKIKRCVVDSLSSIGNSFEEDQFRYFVMRLNAYLKSKAVTTIFTAATASLLGVEKLTESNLSTMTDNIILLKYVEVGGSIKSAINVLKTRGDDHSKSLKEYTITDKGIVVGEGFEGYESIMSGSARKVEKMDINKVLKKEFIKRSSL